MRGAITINAAGITCRFLDIGSGNLFSGCCEKADPWRAGSDVRADITVREAFQPWAPDGLSLISEERTDGYYSRVYTDGSMLWQTMEDAGHGVRLCWQINPERTEITLLKDETETAGYFAFEKAASVLSGCFLNFGLYTVHGVLLEYRGNGIILTADSGIGKTTHARLWRDHKNALIINGDRVSLRSTENGWTGYGLPWSGSSGEQINRSVPVCAVVQICRGNRNFAERISGTEAFQTVLGQLLTPAWDAALAEKAVDFATSLSSEVPVWRLHCTPEPESCEVLEQALFG